MTQEFEARLRATLDESVAHLDGRVRSRLTQARHAALSEVERRARRSAWWRPMVPVAAFGAVAVIAIVTWSHRPGDAAPQPVASTAIEAESPEPMLAAMPGDEVDFLLGEDLFDAALMVEEPAG